MLALILCPQKLTRKSKSSELTDGGDVDEEFQGITCTLHPQSAFRFYWDVLIVILMIYTSIVLPLQMADFDFIRPDGWLIADQVCGA